jgi:hypothetical protein
VGGYGGDTSGWGSALASAELYDPSSDRFTATGNLTTARGGHTALLLPSGKVLIVGGYDVGTYPNVAPAELYDPDFGTFAAAGTYVGRGGCDFCAPSTLLADGTVLFPGQYPAQIYEPRTNVFRRTGSLIDDHSADTLLLNGKVLFAGGESDFGRSATAELYDTATGAFSTTGRMAWRRGWHTLTLLPTGLVLATGGETDSCGGVGCSFAGTVRNAELYDPSSGTFRPAGDMTAAREGHTATLLDDGRVLIAGGVAYGGIGIFFGSLSSAELYRPDVLAPPPTLLALARDRHGQGVILHAGTSYVAARDDPAAADDEVDILCTGLRPSGVIPPQVTIGGRLAEIVSFGDAPGFAGTNAVRVRVPRGLTGGSVVVRLTYLTRSSKPVTMAVK